MSGVVLALIAAAIFGFQNAAARRGVITATPLQGMIITVPTVVPLLAVVCYCLGGFAAVHTWPSPNLHVGWCSWRDAFCNWPV